MQSTKDRLIPINVYRNRLPHRVDGTFSVTDNALCDVGKPKGCTEVGVFNRHVAQMGLLRTPELVVLCRSVIAIPLC